MNGLLLLVLACFRRLRSYAGFVLALSAGPAFTFNEFDRVGGLGFAFDVFCVTLLLLASQTLLVLNC